MKFSLVVLLDAAILLITNFNHPVHGHNILFFTMFGSPSHVETFTTAIEALSNRGHNVTYLTVRPLTKKVSLNITVHHLASLQEFLKNNHMDTFNFTIVVKELDKELNLLYKISIQACQMFLKDPAFRRVAEDRSIRYDLVIMDPIFVECGLVLIPLIGNPPFIYYSTSQLYPWITSSLGITTPASYVPTIIGYAPDLTMFTDRLMNALMTSRLNILRLYKLFPDIEAVVHEVYPTIESLSDIEKNVSFIFANSHPSSLDIGRPTSNYFAEVGGAHCHPPNSLPRDLEEFIAGAGEDGFIYFSFGTYVLDNELYQDRVDAFLGAFRRLKQRVIWKLNINLTDLPSNVKLFKWLPQQDLLGHPKIKVFITQGGQLSSQEAVYHGVPTLGIPFTGDQFMNVRSLHDKGMGEELEFVRFTEKTLYEALMKLMINSSYKDNCRRYSTVFRDRSMNAIDTIVYWVEYVINHDGAKHLRCNRANLRPQFLFQYFLVDVAVVTAIFIAFFIFSFYFLRMKLQIYGKTGKI